MTLGGGRLSGPRQAVLFAGLVATVLACWAYLGLMIRDMAAMAVMSGPATIAELFVMWVVMQAAMMLPSAIPMILVYARLQSAGAACQPLFPAVALFSAGYVVVWSAFSLGAALLHAALTETALLSATGMKLVSSPVAGLVLMVAGIYQWMPWKHACLRRCRTPLGFLMTEWREGRWGPIVMGWRHGVFCVGCCWALMCLLFAAGVMNPIWIVAIAVYVLIEKVAPHGEAITRLVGAGLIAWGG
ncbi:MAG: DUF2182 domain-containing protein, partial [Alphaproteobacteria bacterium]